MPGTAEVIKVEDLEEIVGQKRRCETVAWGDRCERDADVLIRFTCACGVRACWLCTPHYHTIRTGGPSLLSVTCLYCDFEIDSWKEL